MIREDINIGQRRELLKIRCPQCFKLYSVDSAELHESKPKFECLDCQQRFWIPYPEALEQASGLIGFPLEWIEEQPEAKMQPEKVTNVEPTPQPKPFSCPNCSEPYEGGQKECKSCGIIFDKIKEVQEKKKEPQATRELKERWDLVVEAYDVFENHQDFIAMAQLESSFHYALFKYNQVLEVNPSDEIALKAVNMLKSLMEARVAAHTPVVDSEEKKFVMPRLRVGTFIMLLCGILIGAGFLIPGSTNLVGLGSAALFIMVALRYYFRVL